MSAPERATASERNHEARQHQELRDTALAGSGDAMRKLVQLLMPTVQVRVGRALLRRGVQAQGRPLKQESEDIVQDVFAALFEREGRVLRNWDPERGMTLRSFVGLVAERETGMILRTNKRSPFTETPSEADTIESYQKELQSEPMPGTECVESRELLRVIWDSLCSSLSPQGLQFFELLFVQDKTTEEIMAITGASRDSVYAWRSRLAFQARQLRSQLLKEEFTSSPESRNNR